LQVFEDLDQDVAFHFCIRLIIDRRHAKNHVPKKSITFFYKKWMSNGWSNLAIQGVSWRKIVFHHWKETRGKKKIGIIWKIKRGSFCSQAHKKTYICWSLAITTFSNIVCIRLWKKDPNLFTMTLIILFVEMLNFSYLFYLWRNLGSRLF